MAFTDALDVDIGDATKASDYDLLADNPEWLRSKADVEHDFDISTGTGRHNNYLFGTGADGAIANITDADFDATTVAQSGIVSLASNRIIRATGAVTLSQTITVGRQDGQLRGSFPVTHGSPGIPLGAILAAIGSTGIPVPIRPGADGTGLCGGILQILAAGNVAVGGAITATGTNTTSDGGGGGGLVLIVSAGTISGSSAINVSGADGHATAGAKAGAGSYSGEPGGHAGYGGSGGGAAGWNNGSPGAGGAGLVVGKSGGDVGAGVVGGGGGGCLDNVGADCSGVNGGDGADGDEILANYSSTPSLFLSPIRTTAAASANGQASTDAAGAAGAGGDNGGGGGGGGATGSNFQNAGNGGAAQATGCVGSGGGGGGSCNGTNGVGGTGGDASNGSEKIYSLSSLPIWAGLPGGQGGGGGGAGGRGGSGGSSGSGGAAGTGAAGISPFVAGMGAGAGGAGANGAAGALDNGGAGGPAGNGGGAAGLVALIAPSITFSGTVTGRLIKIDGTDAHKFIRGLFDR